MEILDLGNHNQYLNMDDAGDYSNERDDSYESGDDTIPLSISIQSTKQLKWKKRTSKMKKKVSSSQIIKRKKETQPDDNMDEKILDFVKLDCEDCAHKSTNYLDFLAHTRLVHGKPGFVYCCGKKFNRRSKIVDHIGWHINPDIFR